MYRDGNNAMQDEVEYNIINDIDIGIDVQDHDDDHSS